MTTGDRKGTPVRTLSGTAGRFVAVVASTSSLPVLIECFILLE